MPEAATKGTRKATKKATQRAAIPRTTMAEIS